MICTAPYKQGAMWYPCGQCMPCRIARKRVWAFRLELESKCHPGGSVVTLTYEVEPEGRTLQPRDTCLWLKRLRKAMEPVKLRYYLVGEYGSQLQRPHYHVLLFNLELSQSHDALQPYRCQCSTCTLIRSTWGLGRIYVDALSPASIRYVCGYVTKKMTSASDDRLLGRHPEFARMSMGIGAAAVPSIADALVGLQLATDVPRALFNGGRYRALGRYLVRRLRRSMGRLESTPQAALDAYCQEMRDLCESVGPAQAAASRSATMAQKARQVEARASIFKSQGSL